FDSFMEADLFLYYAAGLHPRDKPFEIGGEWWRPWSLAYMQWVEATFLVRAERVSYARRLLPAWRLPDLDTLRVRLEERGAEFARLFDSFGMSVQGGMNLESIASKP